MTRKGHSGKIVKRKITDIVPSEFYLKYYPMFGKRRRSADKNNPAKGDQGVNLSDSSSANLSNTTVKLDPSKTDLPAPFLAALAHWDMLATRANVAGALKAGLGTYFYLHSARQNSTGVPAKKISGTLPEILATPIKPIRWDFCRIPKDLDFAVLPTRNYVRSLESSVSRYAEGDYKFKQINSPPFRGRKLEFPWRGGDGSPTLEAAGEVYVRCPGNAIFFDVGLDQILWKRSKPLLFSKITSLAVLAPPEFIIFEKLLAGRGPEEGKHDFVDALALLVTQGLDAEILRHLVERQRYLPKLDPDWKSRSPDRFKRNRCIKRLFESINKIQALAKSPDQSVIYAKSFGSTSIEAKLAALRKVFIGMLSTSGK